MKCKYCGVGEHSSTCPNKEVENTLEYQRKRATMYSSLYNESEQRLRLAADRIKCLTDYIEECNKSSKWVALGRKYEEEARNG